MKKHDIRTRMLRALGNGAAALLFAAALLAASDAMASAPAARPGDRTLEPALAVLAALGSAHSTPGLSAAGFGDGDSCTVILPLGPSGAPVPVVLFPTVLESDLAALTGAPPAAGLDDAFSESGCRFLEGGIDLFE